MTWRLQRSSARRRRGSEQGRAPRFRPTAAQAAAPSAQATGARTQTDPAQGPALPAEVMWFRGHKATLRDQADVIERNQMRNDQIDARARLADSALRIKKLVDRVGR